MGNVLLLGGGPMIGKSTVALEISSHFKINCISTDDIAEILQSIDDISPIKDKNFLEYYAINYVNKLILDISKYHKTIEPAIHRIIDIHSSWGSSLILERWAIYPNSIIKYKDSSNIKSLWLIAENSLLEEPIRLNVSFNNENNFSENDVGNYVKRSIWHYNLILDQCKINDCNYIVINRNKTKTELFKKIITVTNYIK